MTNLKIKTQIKYLHLHYKKKSLKCLTLKFGLYNCLQILTILHFVCRPMVYIVIS